MRRMYVPSLWLFEYKDDKASKYYLYTKYPLADEDLATKDIQDVLTRHADLDALRVLYAGLRNTLIDYASNVFPELSEVEQSNRQRLAREILKMEPGVEMLGYRAFLMKHPAYLDSRETFDLFLERYDEERIDQERLDSPRYAMA